MKNPPRDAADFSYQYMLRDAEGCAYDENVLRERGRAPEPRTGGQAEGSKHGGGIGILPAHNRGASAFTEVLRLIAGRARS